MTMHPRSISRSLLWLLAALLLPLALPSPAAALEASPYGINVHVPQGEALRRLLDRTQAAGIGWIRIDFIWAVVEPQQGTFDWRVYDAIASAARARGIEVFATLAYTPAWATHGPAMIGAPDDPDDWADVCFRAARRYQGSIRWWGMWNEPNLDHFWAGTRQQYIDDILIRGADAIHAGNPAAKVGGPELAHLTAGHADWYTWLLESIQQAGGRLDFVTHHLYDGDGNGDVTDKLEDSTPFGRRPQLWGQIAPSVKEVLREAGWLGRPFWLTETGWATDRVTEERQAAFYSGLLGDWWSGRPGRDWIDKVFFYEIEDAPPGSGVPLWGVLRANGSAKPAFSAYRDFIAAHPPGPPPPPAVAAEPLPLLGGRFRVAVRWRDHAGGIGAGHGVAGSAESGFFWFFNSSNIELAVKVLDGGPVNGRYWVFHGALSDVEYWIDVTDTATGETRTYYNPEGELCGGADTSAFASATTAAASLAASASGLAPATAALASCANDGRGLCLFGGRFRVEVQWRTADGTVGTGMAVPRTDESGTFWFFSPANVELVVKVLDGRSLNDHFWVFFGALSDVEYRVTVTDLATNATKSYLNRRGSICGQADTSAF